MVLLFIVFVSALHLSSANSEIDRQSSGNDNYDNLNRYKPGDSSSYGTSGGYFPRTVYDQINQNRLNNDLSGREFRPPNVFAAGPVSSPYLNPLLAQPRQYQVSIPGAAGLMPYQLSSAPFLQSPGYGIASPLESQYTGYNSALSPYGYGGVPRIGIGETVASAGQGLGNYLTNPYYGLNGGNGLNRQSLAYAQQSYLSPLAAYGAQGYAHSPLYSPQLSQVSNYLTLGYANQPYGHVSRTLGAHIGGYPYQNQPLINGQYGYNSYNGYNGYNSYNGLNSYNNYNGVNGNSVVGSGHNGVNDNSRDERTYASSSTNEHVAHSSSQISNDTPTYHSKIIDNHNQKSEEQGFYRRKGIQRVALNKATSDQNMSQ